MFNPLQMLYNLPALQDDTEDSLDYPYLPSGEVDEVKLAHQNAGIRRERSDLLAQMYGGPRDLEAEGRADHDAFYRAMSGAGQQMQNEYDDIRHIAVPIVRRDDIEGNARMDAQELFGNKLRNAGGRLAKDVGDIKSMQYPREAFMPFDPDEPPEGTVGLGMAQREMSTPVLPRDESGGSDGGKLASLLEAVRNAARARVGR